MTESLRRYVQKFEYIVTLNNFEDLDEFYKEMASSGRKSVDSVIPVREVQVAHLRPSSLNTHYMLIEWEALELKADPRVKAVELHPRHLGMKPGTYASTRTQTSSYWNKSTMTANWMLNWGLLRCANGEQIEYWGNEQGYYQDATGTVTLTATGKNVDCVIIDAGNPDPYGPEYSVNADGSGGTRMVSYNWYQHNPDVTGSPPGTYNVANHFHSSHVSGTVAGNTQGWARDANIYNIAYDAGSEGQDDFGFTFDYVRAFHLNKSINSETKRKNPTITNNSWGWSLFPGDWYFSDITAVTYRGVRYAPAFTATYLGYSGVCTNNTRLATLLGFENFGNRITTSGTVPVDPGVYVNSFPPNWGLVGGQVSFVTLDKPDPLYEIHVRGGPDVTINLQYQVVAEPDDFSSLELLGRIEVWEDGYPFVIDSQEDGPYLAGNRSGRYFAEAILNFSVQLPKDRPTTYTIKFITELSLQGFESGITYYSDMRATIVLPANPTPPTANVQSITNSLLGTASLTMSNFPTYGNRDDGYWTITLPFNITYLGIVYNTVYLGTNYYLTFGAGSTVWSIINATYPNLPKIMWAAADNSVQRIYYGVEGTSPNRTYRIRVEGTAAISGQEGYPNMINEWVFYEATPSQIDLQCGANAKKTVGSFTTSQLNSWGFIADQRIPQRVTGLDTDVIAAMNAGIICVGAAGNGLWKHDVPGGLDWDNTFEMARRYPSSVSQPYYYMRGSSPTANDVSMPNISVGAVDALHIDKKSYFSDCGPGVDIWAPGVNIISASVGGIADPRGRGGTLNKLNGTSMASPQVCGVLACALEIYPNMTQTTAKAYITGIAKPNQLTATSGGPTDIRDLQGSPNLFLYYKKERQESGNVFPKINYQLRPATGAVYPRPRIKRTL